MGSTQARMSARDAAMRRLNDLTTWIAVGAVAALGVFAVIAAQTIPGKASSNQNASPSTSSLTAAASSFLGRHHRDSGISASSGPGIIVTGGSR